MACLNIGAFPTYMLDKRELEQTDTNYLYFPTNALNLLQTKRNLLYIRNQSVPRCKHFPSRL